MDVRSTDRPNRADDSIPANIVERDDGGIHGSRDKRGFGRFEFPL